MSRTATIALIVILAASSTLWIESTFAQSIPKPATPEFTIQITDRSYDIPTTYSTDTYTGKTITHQGYRVENKTVDLIIKNQQVSQYSDGTANATNLYYYVRTKGHFGNDTDWNYCPKYGSYYAASFTDYTTIIFNTAGYSPYGESINAPCDSQIDFQVQACAGYYFAQWISNNNFDHPLDGGMAMVFHGQKSDWSSIRTLNMADATVSVSPSTEPIPSPTLIPVEETIVPTVASTAPVLPTENPTEAPSQPNTQTDQPNAQTDVTMGIAWKDIALAVPCCIIVILAVALVLSRRKRA